MFVVGLDLSLRSSGCAILNVDTQTWYLSSFAKNESQIGTFQVRENVFVTIFPPVPAAKDAQPIERYVHVQTCLLQELCAKIAEKHRATTCVMVEAYCAQMNQRRSGVRQHESGGGVKCAMHQAHFTNIVLVPNRKWKLETMQKGNATKLDTVHFIANNGPNVDFLKLFGYIETTLCVNNGIVQVPTPVQDLADASAICLSALYKVQNKGMPQKKRKPKIRVVQCDEVQAELQLRLAQKKKLSVWHNTEESATKKKRTRVRTQTLPATQSCHVQDAQTKHANEVSVQEMSFLVASP